MCPDSYLWGARTGAVNPAHTTTTLTVTPSSPAAAGTQETLTATVDPAAAAGTVQLYAAATRLGNNPVTVSNGTATTTATLARARTR